MSQFYYTFNRDSTKDLSDVTLYTNTSSPTTSDSLYNNEGTVQPSIITSVGSTNLTTHRVLQVHMTSSNPLYTTPFGIWLHSQHNDWKLFSAGDTQLANDTLTFFIPSNLYDSSYYGIEFANLISGNPSTSGFGAQTVSVTQGGTIGDHYIYNNYYSRFNVYQLTTQFTIVNITFNAGPSWIGPVVP